MIIPSFLACVVDVLVQFQKTKLRAPVRTRRMTMSAPLSEVGMFNVEFELVFFFFRIITGDHVAAQQRHTERVDMRAGQRRRHSEATVSFLSRYKILLRFKLMWLLLTGKTRRLVVVLCY